MSLNPLKWLVYLFHLEAPIGNPEDPHGEAKHYMGSTNNLDRRTREHLSGGDKASPILRTAAEQEIPAHISRTWEVSSEGEARMLERQLKNQHNHGRLCPDCNPKGWRNRGQP